MKQDNNSEANGMREAQQLLFRSRKTKLAGGLSKAALIASLVASWTIAGEAIAPSDVAAQEQPPLPPVTVESPAPRPRAATQPTTRASSTRAKHATRRTNRNATRPNPTATPATANVAPPPPATPPKEGSEAAGYRPTTATNFGPLGQTPILDVPYSLNVISGDLIENRLGSSPESVFQISPVVQLTQPNNRVLNAAFNLRGFNFQGTGGSISVDGLRTNMGYSPPIEDKERIEIFTGLTGFLYGPTVVGGMVNYVYKRPTETPLATLTIGDYGGLSGFVHADIGGPISIPGVIPDGMFGYRLNLVEQHGGLSVWPQSEDRQLATLALDWHILPGTTLEVIGTHQYDDQHTEGSYWFPNKNADGSSKFNYSWVPNPSKDFGEPWSSNPVATDRAEINLTSKLNDIFTARLAYAFNANYVGRIQNVTNFLSDSSGAYYQTFNRNLPSAYDVHSSYGLLDAHFNTWSIEHKMTMGYYGSYQANYSTVGGSLLITQTSPTFNAFSNPVYFPEPNLEPPPIANNGTKYLSSIAQTNNYVLGDQIKFNEYLSALVGANYAEIIAKNFNGTAPFSESSAYDKGKLTPSLSLIFKPVPWISTYGTYSQSLEQGAIVPSTGNIVYTNGGQVLAPFVDQEYEIGAKADVHGMLLTAALFDINKALQYAVINPDGTQTYVQSGREDHKGIELTATGNLYEGLRVLGGLTLLNPRVENNQSNTALNGKEPVSVASRLAKLTAEYDLPFPMLRGLTLTGGIYYTGSQAADTINYTWLPSFVTEDVGLRYKTRIPTGQEMIFRLNVTNVFNRAYWIQPNETGMPRTIAFSTQIKF